MNEIHPKTADPLGGLPLAALRAFEAAARLGSFRDAAAEIGLTPSAISHHVRDLEANLGTSLFHRSYREVSLTEAGARLASDLTPAFAVIRGAYRAALSERVLRLSCAPLFAARFLLPRIDELSSLLPNVAIEVESALATVDLMTGRHDLALRYGPRPAPPLVAMQVCAASMAIMAAPGLGTIAGPESPAALSCLPLLSLTRYPDAWKLVWRTLGMVAPQRELFFESYEGVLQAAEDGRGLALVPLIVCQDKVARGSLVRVVEQEFDNGWSYWLVGRANVLPASQLRRIAEWMTAQVQQAMPALS